MSRTIEDVRQYLGAAVSRQGFNAWMAPKVITAEADILELEVEVRPEMTQHHGFVHGGCVSAIADTAAAWSAALATCQDVVTSNYSIQLLAPATGQKIKTLARPIKVGRTSVTVSVDVFAISDDRGEKLCATVLAGIAVLGDWKTKV